MQITATELKMNLGKYLDLVLTEDIWVSKNGRIIASGAMDELTQGHSLEETFLEADYE